MSPEYLTLREAAAELGVHYMTAYRYIRLGQLEAAKQKGIWQVARAELDRFSQPPEDPTTRVAPPRADRLRDRMLAGDLAGSWKVVETALVSGMSPTSVYTELVGPALTGIGDGWESGILGVDEEHTASAIAQRIIGRLGPSFARRGRTRGTVVVMAPSGERHGMGVAMLSDILRGNRYNVADLGPDLPADSAIAAIERFDDLKAVCVSIVYEGALARSRKELEEIRRAIDPDIPILVGGPAVDQAWAATTGFVTYAPSAQSVIDVLETL